MKNILKEFNNLEKFNCIIVSWILIFSSCRYDEGPDFSLRSINARIEGTYDIKKFMVGGNDSTQALKNKPCYSPITFKVTNKKEHAGKFDGYNGTCGFGGWWDIRDHEKNILIQFSGTFNNTSFEGIGPWGEEKIAKYKIIKLKNDEMKIMTTYNNVIYTIEFSE